MNHTRFAAVAVALAMCASAAKGDQWEKKTILTFTAPFEVPGVTLSPGTYMFILASRDRDRNIVRITNKRGDQNYAMVLTIPDYRRKVTDKTVVTFAERAPGAPIAIKVWSFPSDNFGRRFVYPKVKAMELAEVNKQPVPEETQEPPTATQPPDLKQVVKVARPGRTEGAYKPEELQKTDTADLRAREVTETVDQLPSTASPIPPLGILGFLSLIAAAAIRYRKS